MQFYLGTHMPNWLAKLDVPLFVAHRRLLDRGKRLPVARVSWALDSGGFTELTLFGRWRTSAAEYVADVSRIEREVGQLAWVAPQDWMCEPAVLAKTGRDVAAHQQLTVANFVQLRQHLGALVIPVLQGWTRDDYRECWDLYDRHGVNLEGEPLVGLGSVCRRQDTSEAGRIVRSLAPLRLHYFGAKITGLASFGDVLASADSMAWSMRARNDRPLRDCTHKTCSSCPRYAIRWRQRVLDGLAQQRLEVSCAV